MFDWNDARYFLAVAESGSTLSAARALHVSQTTVARRIAALEEALGLTLFDKRRAGYVLTPAGETLLADARAVEASAAALAETAASQKRAGGGTVRLTAEESFIVGVLPPMLRSLRELHPDLVIELDASEEVRDLAAGQADVAIRISKRLDTAGLVGRRVGDDLWTVYCSRGYAEAHAVPRNRRELAAHPLISGGGGEIGRYYGAWLRQNGLEGSIAMQHGSVTGLLSAVRSGLGLAALPSAIAELDPELVRCLPPGNAESRQIWLLTHERLRHTPRVRIVMDFLGERLRGHLKTVEERLAQPAAPRAA
ncbi:LysR family transcriptional regulator [Sphingomonas sp.]|uniref:LysR family transcriptional regulator n=1 Tax=Sphingomonas sp. TaxID=28214 RepID=UPI002DB9CFEF|nr:LysR family transcriptional regulator [Sphingomonas sp.]HEU4969782.1 LysR family transcriptional regulator [Sphingomonas sp.]